MKGAGYVLLRLPLEVRDLFKEWLMANYPDRYRHVFKLIRETRGGKDYDAAWGKRMTGGGPYAWMIGRRFEVACERLGLNAGKTRLATEHFVPPRKAVGTVELVLKRSHLRCHPRERGDGKRTDGHSNDTCPHRHHPRRVRYRHGHPFLRGARLRTPHEGDRRDVAFFAAGGVVIGLWPWDLLAADAGLPGSPRPDAFRGTTLAWNCATPEQVDAAFAHALSVGGKSLVTPEKTYYGGYRGYFADPEGHVWEVVQAPGIDVTPDGRVKLPD